jgi:hypothetical protein
MLSLHVMIDKQSLSMLGWCPLKTVLFYLQDQARICLSLYATWNYNTKTKLTNHKSLGFC